MGAILITPSSLSAMGVQALCTAVKFLKLLSRRCEFGHCKGPLRIHPLVAAPSLSMTSLHTFLKPPARFLATRLAFAERHTSRTRARYAILSSTGRRLTMSARSLRRSSFRPPPRIFLRD